MFGRAGCGGFGLSQLGGICRAAAESWWQAGGTTGAVAAYLAKGAASYAASKVNLVSPGTYDLTDGATFPGWDATNGWKKTVSTQHLRTGIIVSDLTWTVLVRVENCTVAAAPCYASGTVDYYAVPVISTANAYYRYGASRDLNDIGGATTAGVLAIAGKSVYKNGVLRGTIPAGGTLSAVEIYICNANNAGSPIGGTNLNVQAVAIYDNILSAAQVAAVSAAMAAL